jgi:circadian clock protein KaiC
MARNDLKQTGISGLDELFYGGIPEGNIVLVEGTPGAGKTLMGVEFIYRGIIQFSEPGIIVLFETSAERLIKDAAGLGWDLRSLRDEKKLTIIHTRPQIFDQELRSPDSLLLEIAGEMGAKRIFIDGIGLLRSSNGDGQDGHPAAGYGGNDNVASSFRDLLRQLIDGLHRENLTAILSHEVGTVTHSVETLEIAEFLADTVIGLKRGERERSIYRSIEIIKSRGQSYDTGQHTLRITDGRGLEVFRRVQSRVRDEARQPTSMTQRSVNGTEPIDGLMGGGLFEGSVTMVVGVSGVGKTIFSTQMLVEGAKKRAERGLLVTLDEHPAQIQRNANILGLGLEEQVESGSVQILYDSPMELEIDVHFDLITQAVEKHGVKRLVIDGLTTYAHAIGDPRHYREFLHGLISFTKSRLMTTFLNYENPELFGVSRFMPESGASSLVDNIILLNFVELDNAMRRAVTVAKARGSAHQFVTHEFKIQQGGIVLSPLGTAATRWLPFESYYGLLSRAPMRIPKVDRKAARSPEDEERLER